MTSTYWCEYAWVSGVIRESVSISTDSGRITSITDSSRPATGDEVRAGITIPGLANAHSHAFHRALRHRTHDGTGTFWTWRQQMYELARRLDPDSYYRLARATFAEMVQAGITVVGEFHYLHHQPDGKPYADSNAMGEALIVAAREVGIRLTLLDTLYLHGGLVDGRYLEAESTQRRFSDRSFERWADRVSDLQDSAGCRIGAAIHSVRAVDPKSIAAVSQLALATNQPLHAHVSEQLAENQQCVRAHGLTPVGLLAEQGALGSSFTAVHATHLSDGDVLSLGTSESSVCFCPTTERDLADGIGPSKRLGEAGASLSLGSDSNAVIDQFEEMRSLEMNERLASHERGNHSVRDLLETATASGYGSLGWHDGGELEVGGVADFVTVALSSTRTVDADTESVVPALVFAASAADVTDVVIDGKPTVVDGAHVSIDTTTELRTSIQEIWAA